MPPCYLNFARQTGTPIRLSLLPVDRNLRAIAANSPAEAARLQKEESLRTPVFGGTPVAPIPNLSGIGTRSPS